MSGFPTMQFTVNVAYLVGLLPRGLANAATFESHRLLSGIAELAQKAVDNIGGDLRTDVRVAMVGSDGCGEVYRLGWTDGPMCAVRIADGDFPMGRLPSAEGRVLMITVTGDDPLSTEVKVDKYEHGMLHGYACDSPASAVCKAAAALEVSGVSYASYAFNDNDVSGAIEVPLASVADFYAARRVSAYATDTDRKPATGLEGTFRSLLFSLILPEPVHGYAIEMITRAEARGEAVSICTSSFPGLYLVKEPGAASYGIKDYDEARILGQKWAEAGNAHVAVHHSYGSQPSECTLVRKVGGVLEGPDEDCPAVCVSRTGQATPSQADVSVRYYRYGQLRGLGVGAVLVNDHDQDTGPPRQIMP